jgi:hypothetical protein
MKMTTVKQTQYTVRMTKDEVLKLLTKFVEKKSSKKVVSWNEQNDMYIFDLESVREDESKDLDEPQQ